MERVRVSGTALTNKVKYEGMRPCCRRPDQALVLQYKKTAFAGRRAGSPTGRQTLVNIYQRPLSKLFQCPTSTARTSLASLAELPSSISMPSLQRTFVMTRECQTTWWSSASTLTIPPRELRRRSLPNCITVVVVSGGS